MERLTETEMVRRCQHGDADARRQLYELYGGVLYAICCRYSRDKEMAKDLMHDGFIVILTKIKEYRAEGSLEGWCKRVMVNSILSTFRKNNPLNRYDQLDGVSVMEDQKVVGVIDKLSHDDLLDAVKELPDGYRTILNLFAIEGYSHSEIALMLNISEGTSRSQYSRAKAKLTKILRDRGINNI